MMIDNYSRFCMCRELYAETAVAILHTTTSAWVAAYGVPQYIFTDAAPVFNSEVWKDWADLHGVSISQARARNKWQNGLVERSIDTAKQLVRQLIVTKKVTKLSKAMEHAIFVKNCTPILGTALSPFFFDYGRAAYYLR